MYCGDMLRMKHLLLHVSIIFIFTSTIPFIIYADNQRMDQVSESITPSENYDAIILKASSCRARGIPPSEEEQRVAEEAFKLLEKDKDKVAKWIYKSINCLGEEPSKMFRKGGAPVPDFNDYAYILCRLGIDCLYALEPSVLAAKNEQTRYYGVYILGRLGQYDKKLVELTLTVLKRDESQMVKAECITTLSCLNAKEETETILKYLDSENQKVRQAAVWFFRSHPAKLALDPLKARLQIEDNPEVGEDLVSALSVPDYRYSQQDALLAHQNPGIRYGALVYFERLVVTEKINSKDWDAIVSRLDVEKDTICRLKIADCLRQKCDIRCIPVYIEVLKGKDSPDSFGDGRSSVKTHALCDLANITQRPFDVTDEDRKIARETDGDMFLRVAKQYETWWEINRKRVRWNAEDRSIHFNQESSMKNGTK